MDAQPTALDEQITPDPSPSAPPAQAQGVEEESIVPDTPPDYLTKTEDFISDAETGATKGLISAGKTLRAMGDRISAVLPRNEQLPKPVPHPFPKPEEEAPKNWGEATGLGIEKIGEIALMGELTGAGATGEAATAGDKLEHAGKIAKLIEKSTTLKKALEIGMAAIKGGGLVSAQEALHGKTVGQSIKSGAVAAGVGGVFGGAVEGVQALRGGGSAAAQEAIARGAGAQDTGSAIQSELRSTEQPVVPAGAPSEQAGGAAVQSGLKETRGTLGQAVGAAKEAARPETFTMSIGKSESPLGAALAKVDSAIGGETTGLESVKDPALDNVRKIAEELHNPRTLDNNEIDKIRTQLNSEIEKANLAFRAGHQTGDAVKQLTTIKNGFDEEMYSQISDPARAELLRSANKAYAELVSRQTKGLGRFAAKAQAPEQIVGRFAQASAMKQSEAETVLKDLSGPAKTSLQDATLKRIVDSHTSEGNTDWAAVQKHLEKQGDMAKSLFGSRYNQIVSDVAENAKFSELKSLSPEQLTLRYANGGPDKQTEVESLVKGLSDSGKGKLRDGVLRSMRDQNTVNGKTNWAAVNKAFQAKGDMGKSLFGPDHEAIGEALQNLAKRQSFNISSKNLALRAAKYGTLYLGFRTLFHELHGAGGSY